MPEMDTDDMALVGRLMIVGNYMNEAIEDTLKLYDINLAGYGVLMALLRTGEPFALTPNELLEQTMITSGAMTNRINRLETKRLIKRIPSKIDKRSFKVALTNAGKKLSEKAIVDVNDKYKSLTKEIAGKDKTKLNLLLRQYIHTLSLSA